MAQQKGPNKEEKTKIRVRLTFPQDQIKEPVLFEMAKKFDIMPNIRRARVTETVGEMMLELTGMEANLEKGIQFLKNKRIKVDHIEGEFLE